TADAAHRAEEHFQRVVQRGERPDAMPELAVPLTASPGGHPNADLVATTADATPGVHIVKLLVRAGLVSSASEARRLLKQGAVRVDGRALSEGDVIISVAPPATVQVGNRRFVRLVDAGG
ncbi:MAG: S4 domain-containing protein, partial [Dehalococcoidia bacterium]